MSPRPVTSRLLAVLATIPSLGALAAQETSDPGSATSATDEARYAQVGSLESNRVVFRDGSRLSGTILGMRDGVVEIEGSAAATVGDEAIVKAGWARVAEVHSTKPLTFVLRSGDRVRGAVRPGLPGSLVVESPEGEVTISIRRVAEIEPPEGEWRVDGAVSLGASMADGNTDTRGVNLLAEVEAEMRQHRISLRGLGNWADSAAAGVTARNWRAVGKYDYFITSRLYAWAGGTYEEDSFRALNWRGVASIGPGYAVARPGDYPQEWLDGHLWMNELEADFEAGISYVTEDIVGGPDREFVAARWAARLEWPILPGVTIYHRHEGLPDLEDLDDLFVRSEQGLRVALPAHLEATLQLNWEWDNRPSPGRERSDFLWIFGLGYRFEL